MTVNVFSRRVYSPLALPGRSVSAQYSLALTLPFGPIRLFGADEGWDAIIFGGSKVRLIFGKAKLRQGFFFRGGICECEFVCVCRGKFWALGWLRNEVFFLLGGIVRPKNCGKCKKVALKWANFSSLKTIFKSGKCKRGENFFLQKKLSAVKDETFVFLQREKSSDFWSKTQTSEENVKIQLSWRKAERGVRMSASTQGRRRKVGGLKI